MEECAHCALPLGRRLVTAVVAGVRERFCCYGCALALQVTRARGEGGAASAIAVRLGLAVFFTVNVMMVSMPTYVPYVYGTAAGPVDGPLFVVLRVLALVLAAPVLLLLGWPILRGGWEGLRAGTPNADLLIVVGTVAAYGVSLANTLSGATAVYYDTAAMLLVLVTLGRFLEARARAVAGAAVRRSLAPAPAGTARRRDGGWEVVEAAALVPGDVVRVGAGEAFPTDGVILSGTGGVDESALTGEGTPVEKAPGASVAGGTASVDGCFTVQVAVPASASAAARIAALAAAVGGERIAAQRLADRVAGMLVPVVVVIALAAGVWWGLHDGAGRGVLVAMAVLVVACPCALGIATPTAVWVGLAAAARRGIVLRSAPVLERLAAVRTIVFDKTGTLTERTLRLTAVSSASGDLTTDDVLIRAAALESDVRHPLAEAVTAAARGLRCLAAENVRVVPGGGVHGIVGGEAMLLGSPRWLHETLGVAVPVAPGTGPIVVLATPSRVLGTLRFAETPVPEARSALAALRTLGLEVRLLTGDAHADAVVPGLLPACDTEVGLLPDEKVARVRALKARPAAAVAMVGDGFNDAPALAAADVGIAVGEATDLTRLTGDVVLAGADLMALPWLIVHARLVLRVVRQNLVWAFAYNAIAVTLAAAGALNPLIASLAMLASSLMVVANARRLRRDVPAYRAWAMRRCTRDGSVRGSPADVPGERVRGRPAPSVALRRGRCSKLSQRGGHMAYRTVGVVAGFIGILAAGVVAGAADEAEAPGQELYRRYCSACHGPQAKGDGVASSFMRPSPPDLTLLAKRHGGEFPLGLVVEAIDGREMPRVHGDPAMPVWGTILSEQLGSGNKPPPGIERRVQGQILAIAEYLRGIQAR